MTTEKKRRLTSLGLLGVGVVTGLLLGAQHFGDFRLPMVARVIVVAIVVVGSVLFTWRWWRLLDEVAREAHKFAWYWGGSAGMAAGGLLAILVEDRRIAAPLFEGPSPADGFVAGVLTVMIAQLVGYTVAWAGWWWSRR
jgi:hypothetical protein